MHGTQTPATVREFAKLKIVIAQARAAQERRSEIYARILNAVEDMVGQEKLINNCTIAKRIGLNSEDVRRRVNRHRRLASIICAHQRIHGSTVKQRRKLQGRFMPHNH